MVVCCSVVLTLLISVFVKHQVSLQSLHLLLPVVVSERKASKPPDTGIQMRLIRPDP